MRRDEDRCGGRPGGARRGAPAAGGAHQVAGPARGEGCSAPRTRGAARGLLRRWPAVVLACVLVAAAAAPLAGCGGSAAGGAPGDGGGQAPRSGAGGTQPSPVSPASSAPAPASSPAAGAAGGAAASGGRAVTRVAFVDVGQGDATVVRSGAWAGLVDGGPSGSAAAVGRALTRLKVRRLSAVVVSHMHADHTGGLPGVVRRFRPRTAYVAGPVDADLRRAFAAAGTRVVQVRAGRVLPAWGAARAKVLSPATISQDENDDSIVVLLRAGGVRFLLTGDCTGAGEDVVGEVCARGPPVTVLKVSHHGSDGSTYDAFLDGVRPRYAVISVGPNEYGHPTRETLARLRAAGATVYTTWKNGTVTFTVGKHGALSRSCSLSGQPVRGGVDARAGVAY